MTVPELLKTIYLGDRACKSIMIDGWRKRVVIQVDEISRIRSASGHWDYYNDENIVDGLLTFTDVRSIQCDPSGPIPNDYINSLEAEPTADGYYRFTMSINAVREDSPESKEVVVTIESGGLHLEDPTEPGKPINT